MARPNAIEDTFNFIQDRGIEARSGGATERLRSNVSGDDVELNFLSGAEEK